MTETLEQVVRDYIDAAAGDRPDLASVLNSTAWSAKFRAALPLTVEEAERRVIEAAVMWQDAEFPRVTTADLSLAVDALLAARQREGGS